MRLLSILVALLAVLTLTATVEAASPFSITVEGQQISLRAEMVPLDQLLVDIARQTGIDMKIESVLEESVAKETASADFVGLPMEDAFRRLLRGKNTIFVYTGNTLSEVRIYLEGTGSFRSLAPAKRTATKEVPSQQKNPRPPRPDRHGQPLQQGRPDLEHFAEKVDQLASAGNEAGAAEAAFELLERDRDREAREAAMSALLGLGPLPVDPLLKVAAAETDPDLKIQALELLSEHGASDPRVADFLAALAKDASNEDVRDSAGSLLESLKTPTPEGGRSDAGTARPQRPNAEERPSTSRPR